MREVPFFDRIAGIGDGSEDETRHERRFGVGTHIPAYQHAILRWIGQQGGIYKKMVPWLLGYGLWTIGQRDQISFNDILFPRPTSKRNTNRIIGRWFDEGLVAYHDGWLYLSPHGNEVYGFPYTDHVPYNRQHLHHINQFRFICEVKHGDTFVVAKGTQQEAWEHDQLEGKRRKEVREVDLPFYFKDRLAVLECEISHKGKSLTADWVSKIASRIEATNDPLELCVILYDKKTRKVVHDFTQPYPERYFQLEHVSTYELPIEL